MVYANNCIVYTKFTLRHNQSSKVCATCQTSSKVVIICLVLFTLRSIYASYCQYLLLAFIPSGVGLFLCLSPERHVSGRYAGSFPGAWFAPTSVNKNAAETTADKRHSLHGWCRSRTIEGIALAPSCLQDRCQALDAPFSTQPEVCLLIVHEWSHTQHHSRKCSHRSGKQYARIYNTMKTASCSTVRLRNTEKCTYISCKVQAQVSLSLLQLPLLLVRLELQRTQEAGRQGQLGSVINRNT